MASTTPVTARTYCGENAFRIAAHGRRRDDRERRQRMDAEANRTGARPTSRPRTTRRRRPPRRRASRGPPPNRRGGQQRHRQKACPDRDAADAGHRAIVQRAVGMGHPAAGGCGCARGGQRAGGKHRRNDRREPRRIREEAHPRAPFGARRDLARNLLETRRTRPAQIGKPLKIDAGGWSTRPTVEKSKFSLADHTFSGCIFESVAIRQRRRCRSHERYGLSRFSNSAFYKPSARPDFTLPRGRPRLAQ